VGFYGDTGDRTVTEGTPPGEDFLAHVCVQWEGATTPAVEAGVRVVLLRTGLVIGPDVLLMKVLGLVFRAGLGGRLGSGRQYWPWIGLDDEIGAIRHLLVTDVSGPVNLSAPTPATNAEFTTTLGRIVHRPTVLAVPRFALSAVMGEFGRSSVLGGQNALPEKLTASGFRFVHTDLAAALRSALGRG
jgi:hypothetical protein